jgi:hypothetical protein
MSRQRRGIGIYSGNRYYWACDGTPVLLLGGSPCAEGPNDVGVFHLPDLVEHLDALVAVGGNWMRCLMSGQHSSNRWPFARVGDRYDLDQWNEEYWERFELYLRESHARGLVTDCELWATFDYYRDTWLVNPFNPANNVNYSAESTGIPTAVDTPPSQAENSFFWTVPEEHDLTAVLRYQQRFVDRILFHTLRYDHVLYCMDNETMVTPKWGEYWARYVRRKAAEAGKTVYLTEMRDPNDMRDPEHLHIIDRPDLFDYIEIAQNNIKAGRIHYDGIQYVRTRIAAHPRPLSNVKVYGTDGSTYFGPNQEGIARFWRNLFGGAASARFHEKHLGFSEAVRHHIRRARAVTAAFDIFACEPRQDLLHTEGENTAYGLAQPGAEYAVYFTDGGAADLDVTGCYGVVLRWYSLDRGDWVGEPQMQAGACAHLQTPGPGQWVAVVRAR